MEPTWNDGQPIYRQLRDRVVAMILDGVLNEGDPLPSVRTVAAEYRLNPMAVLSGALRPSIVAHNALSAAARLWFLVALVGQWIFVYYIVHFYAGGALQGGLQAWTRNRILKHGIVAGDSVGNLFFAAHVLLAAIITFGGPLQLIPQLRARFPRVHRWNGRVYMGTAFLVSVAGLYMNATRETISPLTIGNAINAALIMICAGMALRHALAREFDAHRRWALRMFLMVGGVWFMRVAFGFWILVHKAVLGHTSTLGGSFALFLAFGHFIVPLAILELYLRAKDRAGARGQFAMAAALLMLSIVTGVGVFGATMVFWRPYL